MDTINQEDWAEMMKLFPYTVQGRDKSGRPILLMNFKKWDISKWNLDPEKHKKLVRHFNKMTDDAAAQVFKEQQAGKNVTQFLWLVDMDKVNVMQHVNIASATFYWDITNSWEINNPKLATKIMLLNSPSIFHNLIIPGMRQIMSDHTNNAFDDYRDKATWKPLVDNLVDVNQLPPQYGGTKGSKKMVAQPHQGGKLVGTFQKRPDGTWVTVGK
ncbi:Retinal-binding protein [Folsomia candida]|uniref:Retinal-binding protein n=2 Tax=Folsomia candida TaxID=158441 RepID=A0A226EZP3_FOLCA|nr:Retinal-binding protein [Folsomia candida]